MSCALWSFLGAVTAFAFLHLSARAVCFRSGHKWSVEVKGDFPMPLKLRCRRCRRWSADT